MLHRYVEHFSASYDEARSKFRAAVDAAGGDYESHVRPVDVGAQGETLAIDVGRIGNARSPRQLLMISATHGNEGFPGAALQVAWLRRALGGRVLAQTGIVLVHGLNPYGFSHGMRTTREGVDLNRNFIDHVTGPPDNALYRLIHPYLVADMNDESAWQSAERALNSIRTKVGEDTLFDAIARGQYSHADGIFYGGAARTWENRTLEAIVRRHLCAATKVAVIDWHTGIGAYGEPFFLAFADEESEAQQQTAQWWGEEHVATARPHGRDRPRYRGLVFDGVKDFLPSAQVAGGVIEWGTRGAAAGDVAIRQDLWLRRNGGRLSPDALAQIRADLLDSLNPVSYVWRNSVLEKGMPIIDATVDGLTRW
jgi:hypothetical protein